MKFMGSKNRIAKDILPIMLASRKDDQTWVEPFVGGGNLIDKVSGPRLGSDADKFVISALVSIRDNIDELPRDNSEFSEEDYRELRYSEENPHKGYCGFSLSYGGKWLGGGAETQPIKGIMSLSLIKMHKNNQRNYKGLS